jgi:negative regulator of replication initiation
MGNLSGVVGSLKKELERAQQEVQQFTAALAALGRPNSTRHHTMSAEGRKRISLAQKLRWAKAKGQAAKPRRTMSASARRRIGAAQRKRWAKLKAGKKKVA